MTDLCALADAVRAGRTSAMALAEDAIARAGADPHCAITRVLADRARAEAARVDALVAAGVDPGPLAGVPYGVKDLFDVAGLATTSGAAMLADAPPAAADAEAVRRLCAAGAVLVATCNMDAFAYGFATVNDAHGTTANPHDPTRLAGGSSGGSAAAVAAGWLPFSLGSDTNGSIRVPAALTGLCGLKPTHGALPMAGVYPFAESFDDIGPFTRTAAELARVWAVLADAPEPVADGAVRVARLGGRFAENVEADLAEGIAALAPGAPVIWPDVPAARAAAFLVTASEGGAFHRAALTADPMAFDPAVRDRLLAGALLPPERRAAALAWRETFTAACLAAMGDAEVVLAPAAPCIAPRIDDPVIMIDGKPSPARADLGIHAQPVSFSGLPSLAVPLRRPGRLPLGVQLIGRPGSEARLIGLAMAWEAEGRIGFSAPASAGAISAGGVAAGA